MQQMNRRGTVASAARVNKNPVRAGLLGTQHSHVNGKLRTMLDSPEYEIVAACEPDKTALERRQTDPLFKGLRWVSEEELLGDPSIQLMKNHQPLKYSYDHELLLHETLLRASGEIS